MTEKSIDPGDGKRTDIPENRMDQGMDNVSVLSHTGITQKGAKRRQRKSICVLIVLVLLWLVFSGILLICGDQNYSLQTVWKVLCGEEIKGATYAIRTIRVPRVLIGTLAGFAFGIAGNTFQKMMRNPLASPDVMGVTSGASAAAVFSMMVLGMSGWTVSACAMLGGIAAASVILAVSWHNGFSVNRMILTGIGIQAMLQAVINFIILKTSDYDVSEALRWLSGSLNGVRMKDFYSFAPLVCIAAAGILFMSREMQILALGEELPILLGINISRTRKILLYASVVLCAGTTGVTGPLASVAFMSGPISARVLNTGESAGLHAGITGAVIVLCSEAVGQLVFTTRYPVGVITGIIGAPYLLYLLMKMTSKS